MKIALVINTISALYNFRKEFVEKLLVDGHEVYIIAPNNNESNKHYFEEKGCICASFNFDRRGTNPFSENRLYRYYKRILNDIRPDYVFTYTVKPNIYCGIICSKMKIKYVASITGLGVAFEKKGILKSIVSHFYKKALKKADIVFFQNKESMVFMERRGIVNSSQARLVAGSGVNLIDHPYIPYPIKKDTIDFVFIGRILKEKGIDTYLSAAYFLSQKYPNAVFHVYGWLDENYRKLIEDYDAKKIIKFHGPVDDVNKIHAFSNCTILPSYHEGTSNVLLETAASGRPIIASDIPGCNNTFDEGITGISCLPGNVSSLITAIERFLALTPEQMEQMGKLGRKKMEKEFDRNMVISNYLEVLKR